MVTYFRNIFLAVWTILVGMYQTLTHLFTRAVTVQYPDEKLTLPLNVRAQLFNNIDDCIGCDQCARICPVDCIYIETVKAGPEEDLGITSTGHKKRLHVVRFDIDMFKCCYCDLCTTVCPTECLYMTDKYENAVYSRDDGIYHFSKYPPEVAGRMLAEERAREEAKAKAKAAAVKKEKAPHGAPVAEAAS